MPLPKQKIKTLYGSNDIVRDVKDLYKKEGLNHPSVKKFVELNNVKTKSDFSNNYGTIQLSGNGSVKSNYVFNINANLLFTPQNFGMVTYIAKDENKTSKEMETILEKVKLIKD